MLSLRQIGLKPLFAGNSVSCLCSWIVLLLSCFTRKWRTLGLISNPNILAGTAKLVTFRCTKVAREMKWMSVFHNYLLQKNNRILFSLLEGKYTQFHQSFSLINALEPPYHSWWSLGCPQLHYSEVELEVWLTPTGKVILWGWHVFLLLFPSPSLVTSTCWSKFSLQCTVGWRPFSEYCSYLFVSVWICLLQIEYFVLVYFGLSGYNQSFLSPIYWDCWWLMCNDTFQNGCCVSLRAVYANDWWNWSWCLELHTKCPVSLTANCWWFQRIF